MEGEANLKRKKGGKQRGKRVSQGGTKTVFMILQIVNPASNFLPRVRSSNEVAFFFPPHLPVLYIYAADKAPGFVKLTARAVCISNI